MKFPELKIDNLKPDFPIIQGGMAIKVSTAKLAAAVAREGGIGVIGGTGLTVDELKNEIKKARELTYKGGIIGVNIMYAASNFKNLLKTSAEMGIDVIISGAGFSRDMFTVGKKFDIPIIPIVSSLKLAKISEKMGAAAIIVEGVEAGGHLGTDKKTNDILETIKGKISLPIIAAGNIIRTSDIKQMFYSGLDGVQMGTRFLLSKESNVSDIFKKLCVKATKEDIFEIMSSVGLKANAIKTRFSKLVKSGKAPEPETCDHCLKHCSKSFCIKKALLRGRKGDKEKGIFFTGKGVWKLKEVLSVNDIFKRIKRLKNDVKNYARSY